MLDDPQNSDYYVEIPDLSDVLDLQNSDYLVNNPPEGALHLTLDRLPKSGSGGPDLIGRNEAADIVLENTCSSSSHCEISFDKKGLLKFLDTSTNGTNVNGAKPCHGVASIESGFWLSILEAHFVVFIPFRGETQADYEWHVKRSLRKRKSPCVREKPRPPTSKTSVVQMMGKYRWTGECIESEHPEVVHRIVHDNGKLCLAKSFRCRGGAKNEVKLWQLFDQAERLHPNILQKLEIFQHQSTQIIITEYPTPRYSLCCECKVSC